jgi:3-deoxy-D-arabino-heptulosonate 7-phosphate (DAHP) synthase class II
MAQNWTPSTWRNKPIQQVPDYPNMAALEATEAQLSTFPPLVFAGEARRLKSQLAKVAEGDAFLLQGGDCAESFAEHGADNIRDFFRSFLQMAVVLTYGAQLPVARPISRSRAISNCRPTAAISSTASISPRPRAFRTRSASWMPIASRRQR